MWRGVRGSVLLAGGPRRLPCWCGLSTADVTPPPAAAPRPLSEMPGPRSLPFLGTLWRYLPLIGEYQFNRLHRNGARKLAQYGPVVCEQLVPGVRVVWLFDPADVEALFRSGEGRFPRRRSHLAMEHFRKGRPHVYNSGGLLPTNGPEWWRLRAALQRALSRPQNVRAYLPGQDGVLREFVQLVRQQTALRRRGDPVPDFQPQLSRLFFEMVSLVAFDTRLGSLTGEQDSRTARLNEAAVTANACMLRTDNGPQLWRWVRTPLYRRLERALLVLEEAAVELVQSKVEALQRRDPESESRSGPASLLEQYLASEQLDRKDVVGMAVDLLLAGVDTSNSLSSFALYHLATNPVSQARLRDEARALLPREDSPITESTLAGATFTKAVLKETLRLNPVSVGVGRVLEHDTVFSGFLVPKETVVVTQNQVICRQARWFREPDTFVPERWLKGHALYETPHPFLSLPFGHGPRTCIARRLAEQGIHTLLLRLVRDFEISWAGDGPLDCVSQPINWPDQPMRLVFKPATE